jgi:hypothetical protein
MPELGSFGETLLSNKDLFDLKPEDVVAMKEIPTAVGQMEYVLEHVTTGKGHCDIEKKKNYDLQLNNPSLELTEDGQGNADFYLSLLTGYANLPIIEDGFGSDHDARRAWRTHMMDLFDRQFKTVWEYNKLRWNQISALYVAVDFFLKFLREEKHFNTFGKVVGAFRRKVYELAPNEETYNQNDEDGKKRIVYQIEEEIVKLFDTLNNLSV